MHLLEITGISLYSKEDTIENKRKRLSIDPTYRRGTSVESKNSVNTTKTKPYDESMWERWAMYDNMPYIWDPDLNVEKTFKTTSGNIIKSYRIQMDEPIEIKHE